MKRFFLLMSMLLILTALCACASGKETPEEIFFGSYDFSKATGNVNLPGMEKLP